MAGLLSLCVAALLLCTNDINPFATIANARAHIVARSFRTQDENDSIPIFTRQTIDMVIALREKVDSVLLVAPSNRMGDTLCLRPGPGSVFDAKTYRFEFSLSDTGLKSLALYTCRSNGEIVVNQLNVRAYSPLRQAPISGIIGDSVTLVTPAVGDEDVWYCWSFGEYTIIKSTVCSLRTVLPAVSAAWGTGRLWVVGLRGERSSPAVSFAFMQGDTSPPVIELAADVQALVRNDTIATGDSIMAFRVKITDQSPLIYATVNDSAFTARAGDVYSITLRGLTAYSHAAPLAQKVVAADRGGRIAQRTFYIVYDSAASAGAGLAIMLYAPPANPWVSGTAETPLIAAIENLRENALDVAVRVTVNGLAAVHDWLSSSASLAVWSTRVRLTGFANTVAISLIDTTQGDRLDTTLTITHAPMAADTIPPVIADLSVDGKKASGLYSTQAAVTLRIIAFDQGSGIRTLTVNGAAARPDTAACYVWYAPVALEHDTAQALVTVQAIDSAGNPPATQTVWMLRNHPPRMTLGIDPATPLRARQSFRFEFKAHDDDGDPVTMEAVALPPGMTLNGMSIHWTPADSQAGSRTVRLRLRDPFEATLYSVTLTVLSATPSPPQLQLFGPGGEPLSDHLTLYDTSTSYVITVRIEDPDPPSIDRHQVAIDQGGGVTVMMLDSTRQFTIAVNPARVAGGYDTLRIMAVDVADFSDTAILALRVLHYEPPVGTAFTMGDTSTNVRQPGGEDCVIYANILNMLRVSLDRTATVKSISMYSEMPGGPVRLCIYDATGPGGDPGALMAQTGEFTIGQMSVWTTQPVLSPATLQAGTYWIGLITSSNNVTVGCRPSAGSLYKEGPLQYGPLPAIAPAMLISAPWTRSFYATLR